MLPWLLLGSPLVFAVQDTFGQPFWEATFPLTYISDDFPSIALNLICLLLSHGHSLSPFLQSLALANLKVVPRLPLPSHWLYGNSLLPTRASWGQASFCLCVMDITNRFFFFFWVNTISKRIPSATRGRRRQGRERGRGRDIYYLLLGQRNTTVSALCLQGPW